MKKLFLLLILCVGLLCISSNAFATFVNITIYDENSSADNGWFGKQENDEVEPGMTTAQIWDLEAMYYDASSLELGIVGGYNFRNGVADADDTDRIFYGGDIFIDIDGNAHYDNDTSPFKYNKEVEETFGYDFVFSFERTGGTPSFNGEYISESWDGTYTGNYNVIDLRGGASTYSTFFKRNNGSNPWMYANGGTVIGSGQLSYPNFGGVDYALGVNLGIIDSLADVDLNSGFEFIAHYTMQCGNDNIIGKPVPEPATMLLLGSGLFALAIFGRRKIAKK